MASKKGEERIELLEEFASSDWQIYGRWRVKPKNKRAREIAAAVGVPGWVIEEIRAIGGWPSKHYFTAWYTDPTDWMETFKSVEEADPYLAWGSCVLMG